MMMECECALLEILKSVQKYIQKYLILYYNIHVCKIIHSRYQPLQFVTRSRADVEH